METDARLSDTKVSLQVSGVLPQDSTVGGESQLFPPGYVRPNFTWFTFTTSSQVLDVNWGIRSGCFDDTDSMFYNSDGTYGGLSPSPFNDGNGKFSISKTASMVYKSFATQLNDGKDLAIDNDKIDLLGILNFKRSQYRDNLEPGTFSFSLRTSGSAYTTLTDDGATAGLQTSVGGAYTNIQNVGGGVGGETVNVGRMYVNRGIAIFDLFKTFFPSSTDRDVSKRSDKLPFITGSTNAGTVKSIHKIGFFSGSDTLSGGTAGADRTQDGLKRVTYKHADPHDILSFYSASYSQSINTLSRDFSGVRVNASVIFKTTLYFCRAFFNQYNYSTNPTYTTGSFPNTTYRLENPETFITTVGLFNNSNECIAVGKLSQPLRKDFGREAIIRLRLDF